MKKPAPLAPARPPPDAPDKRVQETENVNEDSPGLAAKKRLEALEAIKRSQPKSWEQTHGQEDGDEKEDSDEEPGSQAQDRSKK